MVCQVEENVFEGVFGLTLHRQNIAEVADVVLPEYLVLDRLNTMKDGLYRYDGYAVTPYSFYIIRLDVKELASNGVFTLFSSFFTTFPKLLLLVAFANHCILFAVHA